jgi:hypothetical protein
MASLTFDSNHSAGEGIVGPQADPPVRVARLNGTEQAAILLELGAAVETLGGLRVQGADASRNAVTLELYNPQTGTVRLVATKAGVWLAPRARGPRSPGGAEGAPQPTKARGAKIGAPDPFQMLLRKLLVPGRLLRTGESSIRFVGPEGPRELKIAMTRAGVALTLTDEHGKFLGRFGPGHTAEPLSTTGFAPRWSAEALERLSAQGSPWPRSEWAQTVIPETLRLLALGEARERLLKAGREALKRLDRRVANSAADLKKADAGLRHGVEAEWLKQHYDGLKAALATSGQTAFVIPETTAPGASLDQRTVSLDRAKSAADLLAHKFHQARRFKLRLAEIRARADEAADQRTALVAALSRFESKGGDEAAEALASLLGLRADLSGDEAVHEAKAARKDPGAQRKPWWRFTSSDGLAIFVGRTAKDNDELTFRHARPHDLWLHVKAFQGSHVVVAPPGKNKPVPDRTLREAALLAAWFSKAPRPDHHEVGYVPRHGVKKPKGAPPGLVSLANEKILRLFVSEADVRPLLATRVEEG